MKAHGFRYFSGLNPETAAVIDSTGQHYSRGELARASDRLSRALLAGGAKPGEVLAMMAPNCVEMLSVYFGATQIGMSVLPLNWHQPLAEISELLVQSGATTLVT